MSYQVLARKWRPRNFAEVVGQEHVLRALINALDQDRLHHAFLFTGTRGIGKTTLARILAKSINCEKGVSSTPCGECSACREIDEGRFVDLIEVDAASRTKVDETRELLDNVQYTPTRGRYKVYLIDEVHMFSNHSFNALLKTLEEPPPHVKFLLATTDPQKLPVTILSRCLQFNLKRLPPQQIAAQLDKVLKLEKIAPEAAALKLLAHAADGSLRDALSLLDQAIAYGGGSVMLDDVRAMLGTIEHDHVFSLLEALADGDAAALLSHIDTLASHAPDFAAALGEMITRLQRIALAQMIPEAIDDEDDDADAVRRLAARLSPEDVQLYYQIALLGRRDLPLAPSPRGGFDMVMLRMLAFRPDTGSGATVNATTTRPASPAQSASREVKTAASSAPATPPAKPTVADAASLGAWETLLPSLRLAGLAQQLAANCSVSRQEDDLIVLTLDGAHTQLHNKKLEARIREALSQHLGREIRLTIESGEPIDATPAQRLARETDARQRAAVQSIEQDDTVRALQDAFDAQVQADTVQPVE